MPWLAKSGLGGIEDLGSSGADLLVGEGWARHVPEGRSFINGVNLIRSVPRSRIPSPSGGRPSVAGASSVGAWLAAWVHRAVTCSPLRHRTVTCGLQSSHRAPVGFDRARRESSRARSPLQRRFSRVRSLAARRPCLGSGLRSPRDSGVRSRRRSLPCWTSCSRTARSRRSNTRPSQSAPPPTARSVPRCRRRRSSARGDGRDAISRQVERIFGAMVDEEFPVRASYGSSGFRLETRDGNWQTNLQWRFQFRFTHPTRSDPLQLGSFAATEESDLRGASDPDEDRRARLPPLAPVLLRSGSAADPRERRPNDELECARHRLARRRREVRQVRDPRRSVEDRLQPRARGFFGASAVRRALDRQPHLHDRPTGGHQPSWPPLRGNAWRSPLRLRCLHRRGPRRAERRRQHDVHRARAVELLRPGSRAPPDRRRAERGAYWQLCAGGGDAHGRVHAVVFGGVRQSRRVCADRIGAGSRIPGPVPRSPGRGRNSPSSGRACPSSKNSTGSASIDRSLLRERRPATRATSSASTCSREPSSTNSSTVCPKSWSWRSAMPS